MRLALAAGLALLFAAPPALSQRVDDPASRRASPEARPMAYAAGFRASAPPPAPVRAVAEFEPAEAVLVSYDEGAETDFWIPLDLIAALSEHTRVLSLVMDAQDEASVRADYVAAGVDMANTAFARIPTDFPWIRDNGPLYIADGQGRIGIVDFIYDVPGPLDNAVPAALGAHLAVPVFAMDLVHSGGNYMTTGDGSAASTDLVVRRGGGVSEATIRDRMQAYLGIEQYHIFPDPQDTYIDHIDTWGKFLDVDTILITQAAPGHEDYENLEAIAAFFAATPSPWGTPYRVVRVFAPERQPYTNSLILNDRVYVPIEGEGSAHDEAALQVYRDAMPGYTVLGFPGNWGSTDALHCRLKEVADTGMLSVRHRPYSGEVPYAADLTFDAEIVAHSGRALTETGPMLHYRVGDEAYRSAALDPVGGATYRATIPMPPPGAEVAYYLSAADLSGRSETFPLVGAGAPRTFRVAPPVASGAASPVAGLRLDASPNPAAGRLTVRYAVADGGPVTLDVLDALGRRVTRLWDGPVAVGEHRAAWDTGAVAPGVYLLRLTGADGARALRRVTVTR